MTHAVDFDPLAWQSDANCATSSPEVFFPVTGDSSAAAKKICAECDVVDQCLNYALDNEERFGVWGNKSTRERNNILKRRTA